MAVRLHQIALAAFFCINAHRESDSDPNGV